MTWCKSDRSYEIGPTDRDWIESTGRADPSGPRGDRGGRRAGPDPDPRPRGGPRPGGPRGRAAADLRGRDGDRLLHALDGPRPGGRRLDRDDRPGPGADGPRPRLLAPGGHRRSAGSRSSTGRPSRRSRRTTRPSPARSTSSSSTPSSTSTRPTSRRSSRASSRARWSSPTTSCGAAARRARRRAGRDDESTAALRAFDAAMLRDQPLPVRRSCRSATASSSPTTAAEATTACASGSACSRSSASSPGRARSPSSCRTARPSRRAGRRSSTAIPVLAPGRPSMRFARNGDYADADDALADGDELAFIPPVSGGSARDAAARRRRRPRPRAARRSRSGRRSSRSSRIGSRRRPTGRSWRSSAGPGSRRGPRRPDQVAEAARHAGRDVETLEYEAHESMALRGPRRHRRRDRGTASASIGWPSSIAPATSRSASRASRSWPSRPIAERRSTRPATRSTRPRRGRRSGRPSTSPTATSGPGRRPGPRRARDRDACPGPATQDGRGASVKVYLSVDMEGIGGISHRDPTDTRRPWLPGGRRAHGRRGQRGDRGRVRRRGDRGRRQRQPRLDVQPRPRSTLDRRAVVVQGQKPWSMIEGAGPDRGFGVALFVGYHTRAGHPTGTIAHTYSERPGRDTPQRPARRRERHQRGRARCVGRAGRPRHGRRDAGRGDRRVAAVGRARGREGRREPARRRVGPPARGARPGPGRGGAGRPAGDRRGAPAARGGIAGDRSRSTTGTPARPITRRSCPAPSASATRASGSAPPTPRPPIAASSPGCGWPASSAEPERAAGAGGCVGIATAHRVRAASATGADGRAAYLARGRRAAPCRPAGVARDVRPRRRPPAPARARSRARAARRTDAARTDEHDRRRAGRGGRASDGLARRTGPAGRSRDGTDRRDGDPAHAPRGDGPGADPGRDLRPQRRRRDDRADRDRRVGDARDADLPDELDGRRAGLRRRGRGARRSPSTPGSWASRSCPSSPSATTATSTGRFPVQVDAADVRAAIDAARGSEGGPVALGVVGAGTGMRAFELKAGIGSASRLVRPIHRWSDDPQPDAPTFTVGVLVMANFGILERLTVDGVRVGETLLAEGWPVRGGGSPPHDPGGDGRAAGEGSCIVVVATDAPLFALPLQRLARRAGTRPRPDRQRRPPRVGRDLRWRSRPASASRAGATSRSGRPPTSTKSTSTRSSPPSSRRPRRRRSTRWPPPTRSPAGTATSSPGCRSSGRSSCCGRRAGSATWRAADERRRSARSTGSSSAADDAWPAPGRPGRGSRRRSARNGRSSGCSA